MPRPAAPMQIRRRRGGLFTGEVDVYAVFGFQVQRGTRFANQFGRTPTRLERRVILHGLYENERACGQRRTGISHRAP